MFTGPLDVSIIGRAQKQKLIEINFINPRQFATDKHKSVDDRPYGGGVGMIMRVDILDKAIEFAKNNPNQPNPESIEKKGSKTRVILLDPQGNKFIQKTAQKLSNTYNHIILICGHYEGVDQRVRTLVDEEVSIGDYVLTGGELPAMVMIDTITRLLPNVLAKEIATQKETFNNDLLEYPQYTRPENYKNIKVPEVLLSGNHAKIEEWRNEQAKKKTHKLRFNLK